MKHLMSGLRLSLVVATVCITHTVEAVRPTEAEMAEARFWFNRWFGAEKPNAPGTARVLVETNHDPVQVNGRNGYALRIRDREFERGFFCHAPSRLRIHLPGPAREFRARIGVDSNDQTAGGRGSVVFHVESGGTELFRSPLMREGMEAILVSAGLKGARELTLGVSDGGDGIACDQADWCDAKIVMANGEEFWLADLVVEQPRPTTSGAWRPFSFVYDQIPSSGLLENWDMTRAVSFVGPSKAPATGDPHDARTRQVTLTFRDGKTGLALRCVAACYPDFPVVEWTLYLKNEGTSDTPLISDFLALDWPLERHPWPDYEQTEYFLHHHTGSPCTATDYQPHLTRLGRGASLRFAPPGGRPSDSVLPYFNLRWPSEGIILAIGWPGQWAAHFERDTQFGLRLRIGQETTRFRLKPGEEVRSPLVVMQFWRGMPERAQNLWRQWMLRHNLPRPGGRPLAAQMAACSSHQYGEMIHANEENQKMFVERYLKHGLKLDYWWMDAGWYPHYGGGWPRVGTWEVDTNRFPRGLRAISDYAHARDVKAIVWFEPERVTPGTWLYDNHADWLLGSGAGQKLLNLGNSQARRWLVEHVSGLIVSQGIDLYRQDFNMDPLSYWRAHDSKDRQGITENHYVSGFLAYWDELRRRFPAMLIDTCASGGRRNDVETLRRSVPLLRSDYILEASGQQNHTLGLAPWVPFYGTGINAFDDYTFRSQMCPHLTACYDMRNEEQNWNAARRLLQEWREIGPLYFGDFHALTPYATSQDVWVGWQFNREDLGQGVVQVFRRGASIYESARLRLRGLDEASVYRFQGEGLQGPAEQLGEVVMRSGLLITLPARPSSAFVRYERIGPGGR